MELYGIYAHAGDLILVRFQKWVKLFIFFKEELKMNEIKECKHRSPIYVVKRIRLLDYLVSKNLFPNAIQPDATNPHYKNWVYRNTPELEAALAEYEPFKRAQQ